MCAGTTSGPPAPATGGPPPHAVWVCWDTTKIKYHKRFAAGSGVKPNLDCPVHAFSWPPIILLTRLMMCISLFSAHDYCSHDHALVTAQVSPVSHILGIHLATHANKRRHAPDLATHANKRGNAPDLATHANQLGNPASSSDPK